MLTIAAERKSDQHACECRITRHELYLYKYGSINYMLGERDRLLLTMPKDVVHKCICFKGLIVDCFQVQRCLGLHNAPTNLLECKIALCYLLHPLSSRLVQIHQVLAETAMVSTDLGLFQLVARTSLGLHGDAICFHTILMQSNIGNLS